MEMVRERMEAVRDRCRPRAIISPRTAIVEQPL